MYLLTRRPLPIRIFQAASRTISLLRARKADPIFWLEWDRLAQINIEEDSNSQNGHRLVRKMIQSGRCPHQARHIERCCTDLETLRYLSDLERSSERVESHNACTEYDSCVAYNVNPSLPYQARHLCVGKDCRMVKICSEKLAAIIRDEKVPLVLIKDDNSSEDVTLELCSRTTRSKYVAISHVWADGLGNPLENGLPQCQIKLMKKNLDQIIGKTSLAQVSSAHPFHDTSVLRKYSRCSGWTLYAFL